MGYCSIAEMLEGLIESDLKGNEVTIIAATESLDLNEKLFMSRGKHYFKNVYNTSDLNKVTLLETKAQFFYTEFLGFEKGLVATSI